MVDAQGKRIKVTQPTGAPPCLMTAWQQHEHGSMGGYSSNLAARWMQMICLQKTFLRQSASRASSAPSRNARAWLFEVARHLVIDRSRRQRPMFQLHDELAMQQVSLMRSIRGWQRLEVLERLAQADRDILKRAAILEGVKQADYAAQYGLTLTATKVALCGARNGAAALSGLSGRRLDETGPGVLLHSGCGP